MPNVSKRPADAGKLDPQEQLKKLREALLRDAAALSGDGENEGDGDAANASNSKKEAAARRFAGAGGGGESGVERGGVRGACSVREAFGIEGFRSSSAG